MSKTVPNQPSMSDEGLMPSHGIVAVNEFGEPVDAHIPGELPLTIRVDGMEVVTLMTLGTEPEALTLGYIRNQKLIEDIELIESVIVDWDREVVDVTTYAGSGIADWQEKMKRRIVTSGCGQGTIFSCTVDKLYEVDLRTPVLKPPWLPAASVITSSACNDTTRLFINHGNRFYASDWIISNV